MMKVFKINSNYCFWEKDLMKVFKINSNYCFWEKDRLSEFGELDLEVVKSFINVGFLKCDNNYIWSEGYSIISYFNRFLVVSLE
ncbi:hypothetical protein DXC58_18515 [Ruminococcus sp. TF06-23]|nr:hypothetical protein DXC58_18515 [Ruminococcus sp. TF06-23]